MSNDRITPFDLIFGEPAFDQAHFELIAEQAATQPARTPTELFMLPAAGTLLRELMPADDAAGRHRELVEQASALLFHAFRFWLYGRRTWVMGETTTRSLLDEPASSDGIAGLQTAAIKGHAPPRSGTVQAPAPAGYVQLPRNLLWTRVAEEAAAEPVDGFFWSMPTEDEGASVPRIDLLLALGVRRGRPGISIVDVSAAGADALQHWADVQARPDGDDFANILPGGELQQYRGLVTRTEALKLAARCFRRVAACSAELPAEGGRAIIDG
jgi:hypothetical protein